MPPVELRGVHAVLRGQLSNRLLFFEHFQDDLGLEVR